VKLFHKLLDWFESLMMNSALRSAGAPKMWAEMAGLEIKPLIHEENSVCSSRIGVFVGLFK